MKSITVPRPFSFRLCAAFVSLTSFSLAAGPAPERGQRRFEIEFLASMVDHHFGGVQLAALAATRATHEELREMAETVQTAQTAEIQQLQTWLQSWYGIAHEPELDRKTRRQIEASSTLSGEEFETEFMEVLFEHHADALRDATRALREACHPELINAAAMMITAQADEMAQLRLWLQHWHEVLDPDRQDRADQTGGDEGTSENDASGETAQSGRGVDNRREPTTLSGGAENRRDTTTLTRGTAPRSTAPRF